MLQTFVDRLTDSRDAEAFGTTMADAAAAFDLPVFAYLRMPRDGRTPAALISTYPARWTERYLEWHYEKLDPVIRLAHDHTELFEWGLGADTFAMSPAQKQLFDEAAEFGIRCGFTIPIQDVHGPVAAVTFASDARRPEFLRTVERNRLVLQLMAILLHAHARRKLCSEPAGDIAVAHVTFGDFELAQRNVLNFHDDLLPMLEWTGLARLTVHVCHGRGRPVRNAPIRVAHAE